MNAPVFIIGCTRSGTTLMTHILNNHSRISILFESGFIPNVFARSRKKHLSDDELEHMLANTRVFQHEKLSLPEIITAFDKTDRTLFSLFDVVLKIKMKKEGKHRFGEKTPRNFLYLQEIFMMYPNALIIFMYRDPRSAYSSLKGHKLYRRLGAISRSPVGRSFYWNLSLKSAELYKNKEAA